MGKFLMKILEWFLMLFLSKKAKALKGEAFVERTKAVKDYNTVKANNAKYMAKFSGNKRYQKAVPEIK